MVEMRTNRSEAKRVVVGRAEDLPPGSSVLTSLGGVSIGVFNINGKYFALRNKCPHQGGPLCLGSLTGTTDADDPSEIRWVRDGEVIRCPWHHWEFDVTTGRSLYNPERRVRTYRVTLEPADALSSPGANASEDRASSWIVVTAS